MEIARAGVTSRARLLYVTLSMEYGGAERQLLELVCSLDARKFEPHVCCMKGAGPLLQQLTERQIPWTVYHSPPLDYSRKIRCVRQMRREVCTLARLMGSFKPHIVHGVLPMACVMAGLAVRLVRVPILVTGRRSLGCYKEGRPLLRFLENLVNRWTDAAVANSEAVRVDTLARERISPGRLRLIYNGVRIPEAPARAGWSEIAGTDIRGPVVCLVANFFPYKGHLEFLDAAAEVARKVPAAQFVLVGDGKLRAGIEKRASAPDLHGRVVLLGSRADSGDVIALSDVVALASHEEGFPNVVLEAMARAKPVVATRVGGVPEAVEEGKTGLLVPPRDPGAMARALIRLLEDPAGAGEMGRRGLDRVRRDFTVERMVRAHEDLYEGLLARKL
ncbi:MAG: glycosyltransferase [Chlamydiota bacterium]